MPPSLFNYAYYITRAAKCQTLFMGFFRFFYPFSSPLPTIDSRSRSPRAAVLLIRIPRSSVFDRIPRRTDRRLAPRRMNYTATVAVGTGADRSARRSVDTRFRRRDYSRVYPPFAAYRR